MAVTFDDAYRSVLESAFPLLARLQLPATVFVPTDFVQERRSLLGTGLERWAASGHEPELAPLTWRELAELQAAGWEVGSHGCSHANLTQIGDGALRDELERSREACEQALGVPCRSLAYPFGESDERVRAAAARAGYTAAGILSWRLPRPQPLAWPRIGIVRRDGPARFRIKLSAAGRLARRPSAWDALQAGVDAVR